MLNGSALLSQLALVGLMSVTAATEFNHDSPSEQQRPADGPKIVIVRNSARPRLAAEVRILGEYTDKDWTVLEKAGYVKVQLEPQLLMIVDPLAPPIRDFRIQRKLMEELGKPGTTKRFGDLSPEAQEAVRATLTPAVIPQHVIDQNTIVGTSAKVRVGMSINGKRQSAFGDIKQSPNFDRKAFQTALSSGALAKSNMTEADARAAAMAVSKVPGSEMLFSASLNLSAMKPTVYRKCTDAIAKMAEDERQRRDELKNKLLSDLHDANPDIGDLPDNGWDKASIPPAMRSQMEREYVEGWKVYGYDSAESASTAWRSGTVTESGVSLFLTVSLGQEGGVPAFYDGEFAFTAR